MSTEEGIGKFKMNHYNEKGKVLISKTESDANLKKSILKAVNLIGGFGKVEADKGRSNVFR